MEEDIQKVWPRFSATAFIFGLHFKRKRCLFYLEALMFLTINSPIRWKPGTAGISILRVQGRLQPLQKLHSWAAMQMVNHHGHPLAASNNL